MLMRVNDAVLGHEYTTYAGIAPKVEVVDGEVMAITDVIDRSPTSTWLPPGVDVVRSWYATADASAVVFQEHGLLPKEEEYW